MRNLPGRRNPLPAWAYRLQVLLAQAGRILPRRSLLRLRAASRRGASLPLPYGPPPPSSAPGAPPPLSYDMPLSSAPVQLLLVLLPSWRPTTPVELLSAPLPALVLPAVTAHAATALGVALAAAQHAQGGAPSATAATAASAAAGFAGAAPLMLLQLPAPLHHEDLPLLVGLLLRLDRFAPPTAVRTARPSLPTQPHASKSGLGTLAGLPCPLYRALQLPRPLLWVPPPLLFLVPPPLL